MSGIAIRAIERNDKRTRVSIKEKDKTNVSITSQFRGKNARFTWLDWNEAEMKGIFVAYPERESVPENIKEQLIVELYSK